MQSLTRRLGLCLVVMLGLLVSVASAGEGGTGIDIQAWLQDPGVKLLAIDFYTEGCAPCRAAAPKWKRLQETYAAQGFRLATIAVGMDYCPALNWTPDYKGCDEDNKIGKAWKVTKLPDAFLYTWQGKPLLEHGTVEQAEGIISQYFLHQPRVLVDMPTTADGTPLPKDQALDLRSQVKEQLRLRGKVLLVPDAKEEVEIKRLRAEQANRPSVDERFCSALGLDLPANSHLKIIKLVKPGEDKLLLELKSLDANCPGATAPEVIREGDVAAAVSGAVGKLLRQLFGSLATPSDDTRPVQGGIVALGQRAPVRPSGPQAGGGTDYVESAAPTGPSSKKGAVTAALAQLSIKVAPPEACP